MARVEKSEPIFSACFLVSWKNRLKQIIVCSPFEEITWYLSWRSWRISFTPKVLCFSFSVVSTQQRSNPHEIQRQWRQKLSNNLAIKETKRFCNNTIDWSYSTSLSKIVTPILHSVVICCTSHVVGGNYDKCHYDTVNCFFAADFEFEKSEVAYREEVLKNLEEYIHEIFPGTWNLVFVYKRLRTLSF